MIITQQNITECWLYKYYDAIRSGEEIAGLDMTNELINLLDDIGQSEYVYDTADADLRIFFIENCLQLTKSPFYGKPFLLLLWEKAFIEVVYSFKIKSLDTGEWIDRFTEILLLIARKNGKTELIAALQLTEMILGEQGQDIICSGMDDGTADLAYSAVDTMRMLIDPKNIDTWRNQKGIRCKINNSHIFKLSDGTRQKEGRNIDIAGIDEIWSIKGEGIYKPIIQSTSTKEKYKIFLFGSEGFIDDGLLDKKRKEYEKIINREDDKYSSKRKLPWFYTQDEEREVWDVDKDGINLMWKKANPSLGSVKKWSYMRDMVEQGKASRSDRAFLLAKDFNFKITSSLTWLDTEKIKNLALFSINDFIGSIALGGVDLAITTDLCSAKILMLNPADKNKYIHSMYWIPEGKLEKFDDSADGAKYKEWAKDGYIRIVEGNEVDVSEVADWYAELVRDYDIRTYVTGYDQRFAKDFIKRMDEYGFETEMIYQNRFVLTNPMKLAEAEIDAGMVCFSNPIDLWCLSNTAIQVWDTGHVMPVKIKNRPGKKIDGTLSLIDVYEIYRRYKSDFMQMQS